MAQVLVTESSLQDIADAIREKNGLSTQYKPSEMGAAIQALGGEIKTASGSSTVVSSEGYGHIIVSGLDFAPCAVYASLYNANAYKSNSNTGAILFDTNGNVVATDPYLDDPAVAVSNSRSYDGGFDWCYISTGGVGNKMYWYAVGV